jgi:ribosomal-protein-alanine N-acetyltransferase
VTIPTISTPRLLLRSWTLEDAPALLQVLQEPDIFRYFPPSPPPTLEKTGRYIAHQLAHWQERGYGHWAVATQADGQVVGWNGLEYLPETDETEVAYLLSRQVWGRGLATEAARAAVEFGFGTCILSAIIGLVHPDNAGSIRVLEKSGLTFSNRAVYWGLEMLRYITP